MSCVSTKLPLIDLSNLGENDSPSYVSRNDSDALVESIVIDGALSPHVVDTFANLMWPDQGNPTFRRMVLESLGLEKYLDEHINSTDYVCRVQKYEAPRTPHSTLGLHSHTDKNIMTILHQLNHVNGLQIHSKDGKTWIPADPTSLDSIIVMTPEELVNEDHPFLYKPFDYYKFINFTTTDAGRASPDPLKEYCGA
ncbi:hypothetical protein SASPL_110197 [Salvia splendens]|uniref:Isopenicillin N synthase-like Fe(2+) 2OG dioxygenase domain-containing protein n=1 Tax=Salvia splendens TaxID=180675 RepID=A0A8X9A3Z9_SALSN|nr:hypothetical protein SASPL_110197 [Salvia splendens]